MIRQSSQRKLKRKSRQKSKTPSSSSQPKGPPHSLHATRKLESNLQNNQAINEALSRSKMTKNVSKSKLTKNPSQTTKPKPQKSQKIEPDTHAIHMKTNLKQLMSKNTVSKGKNSEVVPGLLKNIQKHCKELKKIHAKQQKGYDNKRISLQQNKVSKEAGLCGGNRSQDYQCKNPKEFIKGGQAMGIMPQSDNRFSLQIERKLEKQQDKDPFTNQRLCKRASQNVPSDQNFIQAFKIYKKNFEIEDIKLEKSNRRTNYNTNQSKNSSSLFNSAHNEHSSRLKHKPEEKINLDRIQQLVKIQQRSADREEESNQRHEMHKGFQQLEGIKEKSRQSYQEEIPIQPFCGSKNLFVQDYQEEKLQIFEPVGFNQHFLSKQPSLQAIRVPPCDKQMKQVNEEVKDSALQKELQEAKFKHSKYYVLPIPTFQPRADKLEAKQEDNSLVGCEIPLLQDHMICEDSELASLQL